MKVSIPIIQDSWNSYPQDELEFVISDELVTIKIKDETNDREIAVSREALAFIADFLAKAPS